MLKIGLMLSKENLLKKFGENVKEERGNMSQEDLAIKAHIHINYLGRIERGEVCPSIYIVYKIALALGKRPNDLLVLSSN